MESWKRRTFNVTWDRDEAESRYLRHASEDAKRKRGGGGAAVLIPQSSNAEANLKSCGNVPTRFVTGMRVATAPES